MAELVNYKRNKSRKTMEWRKMKRKTDPEWAERQREKRRIADARRKAERAAELEDVSDRYYM